MYVLVGLGAASAEYAHSKDLNWALFAWAVWPSAVGWNLMQPTYLSNKGNKE
jgi:hypothetical protein